ncbi:MAG: M12 family metallopeptidase [Nitrospira sp.]|nr:M12 family metallopeptidase [Nitrospira sp.]MCP9460647.1 M12 family metallopeptidase [Nitrospira sp.]MCP9475729.1 M12 family metallopeptidase [Nitrospira sp.]
MAERPKVCIDRILPRDLMRFQMTKPTKSGIRRAIAPIGKTWMNGSTLRVRFMGGTPTEQAVAKEQAGWWAAVANLKFEFNNAPNAEIRIAFDRNDGAWSYVGTDCRNIPLDQPTMNLGFLDGGTAAHEFGHAIGLAHEHQNPAGGIQWNEEVVIREAAKAPNFWDEATTRHNILRKYSADQINGTKFDPDSIMLYFFPASWTLNGIGTKANEVLSAMDKAFVAGAKMYPKTGGTVSNAVELIANAKKRTQAAIGKPGEEDLYRFTATTDGRYVIDTLGPTDVVMKLFGPNSETALIAEDDDSGLDLNARIAADLVKGDYFVQVRHYSRQSGTGKYSIKVRKL